MASTFIHLHTHSEYSLIDGMLRIKSFVKQTKDLGMPAVALTDQSNIFAAVKFYQACLKAGIKPIFGADLYLENPDDERRPFSVVALCQHNAGYKNLVQLISKAYLENQHHGKAIVKKAWLTELNDGLIILSGALRGDVGAALAQQDTALAEQRLQYWQTNFPDRFYIELQRTNRQGETAYIKQAMALAISHDLPVLATNDVRFLQSSDFEAHEARVCIHDGYLLSDRNRPKIYNEQQYLSSPEDMQALFADIPEAIENSVQIAKRCTVELVLGQNFLPSFPVPKGMTIEEFLALEAKKGLEARLLQLNKPEALHKLYYDRLSMELEVINKMGFPGYFLIVADFIQWAKENDVPVGPGRGSGAGSIVAYALKITDLDPLQYDLLFERFLNPERVSMPDFDIDFCIVGRDRVIDYVAKKYGRDSVSQIITFGTMAARAVVRDVGRVLGFNYGFVDKLAKLIPFELGITLEKALKEDDLKLRYQQEEEVRSVIDLARSLEGLSRNAGKHAGGVVIAPGSLTNFTALYCEEGATSLVTQFDKDDVESIGLVKFDFLGLRNLTIINWSVNTINARLKAKGEAPVDIAALPLDDEKAYELLRACKTTAVFQLESRGMKDLLRKLQPVCFEDIVPLVALFRPGPLQSGMVDDFVARRHGRARIEYPHPKLKEVLEPTYGVILYQEQVMQIAQVLAGFTLGGADLLRRAMGKKKIEEMARQRELFVEGAFKNDVPKEQAGKIFDLMEKFAGYGFNKSHSAAYGLIAYQTAWLKAHYPAEYMAAVLSSDMDHTDKVVRFFADAKALGLTILSPDINVSDYQFTVNEQSEIVYGLGAIKGAGSAAIEIVLEERKTNGPFKDLFDFCVRNDMRKVNKRVLEALIKSGALDTFGLHRAALMTNLPVIMKSAEQHLQQQERNQHDLFGESAITEHQALHLPEVDEWPDKIRLQGEKEVLGLYLTGHPLTPYLPELNVFVTAPLAQLKPRAGDVVVAGFVAAIRTMLTKRGDRMAFLTLEDVSGSIELAVFASVYKDYKELLHSDQLIVVEGEVSVDDYTGSSRLSCNKLYSIAEAREVFAKRLRLNLTPEAMGEDFSAKLAEILQDYRGGQCPVAIHYQQSAAKAMIPLASDWRIHPEDELIERLKKLLPEDAVLVDY